MKEFRKVTHYDHGFVIRLKTVECSECSSTRTYVEHFFWDDPCDYVDPEIDTPAYIANHADCSRFVCPSCHNCWKV